MDDHSFYSCRRVEPQFTKGRVEENEGQSTELLLEERNDGANLCLSSHYWADNDRREEGLETAAVAGEAAAVAVEVAVGET